MTQRALHVVGMVADVDARTLAPQHHVGRSKRAFWRGHQHLATRRIAQQRFGTTRLDLHDQAVVGKPLPRPALGDRQGGGQRLARDAASAAEPKPPKAPRKRTPKPE